MTNHISYLLYVYYRQYNFDYLTLFSISQDEETLAEDLEDNDDYSKLKMTFDEEEPDGGDLTLCKVFKFDEDYKYYKGFVPKITVSKLVYSTCTCLFI